MTVHAGIIRNAKSLQEGVRKLQILENNIPDEVNEYYNLLSHNLITVARLIIRSALYREESRGGHFREDFPLPNDRYLYHIIQQKNKNITTAPVNTTK